MMILVGICGLLWGVRMLMEAMDTSLITQMMYGLGSYSVAFGLVGGFMIAAGVFAIVNCITREIRFATISRVLFLVAAVTCVMYGYDEMRTMILNCLMNAVFVLWYHKKPAKA